MALTPVERMKKYRQKLDAVGNKQAIQITISKNILSIIDDYIGIAGNSRADVIENAVTTWAWDAAEALPAITDKINKGRS